MADIFHCFTVDGSPSSVFEGISTSKGLDKWWTKNSRDDPAMGGTYELDFGPGYIWSAVVTKYIADREFELTLTDAHADWLDTKVGFSLTERSGHTVEVNFYHTGWPENNEHYRISSYCWAMYLRILKRYVEFGEEIPYENRLSV
jgi:uncharacterized protein YndB with AHSA1/START domain